VTRIQLILRVRSYTRDFSNSIFREIDITDYLNEAIDRVREVITECEGMVYLTNNSDVPTLLPSQYHYLLSVYAASRCYSQDGNDYKGGDMMNEFESKLNELQTKIDNGDVIITDINGNTITNDNPIDYVDLSAYWNANQFDTEEELGVEGVE